ncbi:MAG: hemerythrin domain-containing protein [Nitrospirota bacterium]|nr:hemerythrin domain-containing protein [Nitrospirota bacterium]
MSDRILKVKYTCQHPSCVVFCKKGELLMSEAELAHCSSFFEDEKMIRSPKHACRLGYSQPFEVAEIEVAELSDLNGVPDERDVVRDPIANLMAEHNMVLEKAQKVEEMLTARDLDGLWTATNDLDNALHLHSGIKEEEVLFPMLKDLVPFGEGLIICINEDHREIASLVHSFREALRDDTINDKVIGSALVALRSHVRKEDNEFFAFVKRFVTDDMNEPIMTALEQAEKNFVPKEAGERMPDEEKAAERHKFHSKTLAAKEIALDTCCH